MIEESKIIYFWDFWDGDYDYYHKLLLEIFKDRMVHIAGWSVDEFLEWRDSLEGESLNDFDKIRVFSGPYYNTMSYLLENPEPLINMTILSWPLHYMILYHKKLVDSGYTGSMYQWVTSLDWEERFSNFQSRSLFIQQDPRFLTPSSPEMRPDPINNVLQSNLESQREFVRLDDLTLFSRARSFLDSFYFVGIRENYLSAKVLCQKLGVEQPIHDLGTIQEYIPETEKDWVETVQIIENANRVDYELYEYYCIQLERENQDVHVPEESLSKD